MGLHQPAVATFDEHESPTATVTMPAPVSLVHSHATPVPMAGHATSIPAFDLAALAATTAIDSPRRAPMDRALAVPVRTSEPPTGVDLRSAFLLLHVDGSSCIGDIARSAGLPVDEVIAIFLELVAMGSVAFLDSSLAPPSSGVFSVSIFQEGAATKRR